MPVQRRVFRIEQGAHAPELPSVDEAEATLRHHEFMTEIKALRALVEPRAAVSREAMDHSRAQIAEAQAYKHELELSYAAVKRTQQEIDDTETEMSGKLHIARLGRELDAIVTGTEQATQSILKAAEDIDKTAHMLVAALKNGRERNLAHDVQDRVVQIFEACNFQDLTGQRVSKVVTSLKFIEEHVARLMQIWNGIEQFKPIVLEEPGRGDGDERFLNGPMLDDEPATPRKTTSTSCSAAPSQAAGAGRRIAAKHASAISASAAANASAAGSEMRSARNASTSGAAACMISEGPAMRPTSRP